MDDDLQGMQDSQPWEELYEMLTAFAKKLLTLHSWRSVRGGPVPGGLEAQDFAIAAIEDVYSGKRKWDRERYPSLAAHLRWVVRSKVSNAVMGAENRAELRQPDAADQGREAEDETFFWGFLEELSDEPQMQAVLECLHDGIDERTDIAEKLQVAPEEITNLRKRLKRRTEAYVAKIRRV